MTLNNIPVVTSENVHKISFISFWIALFVVLIQYPFLLYVYFIIQWAISVGGICLVTNGFTNLKLLKWTHFVRYIIPIILLYIASSLLFDIHYHFQQYVILFGGFLLYSLILWIWKRKNPYDVYGKHFPLAFLSIFGTALIWN